MRSDNRVRAAAARVSVWPAVAMGVLVAIGVMLSGCNTASGVGQDVSATGHAVTRGAQDVKSGL